MDEVVEVRLRPMESRYVGGAADGDCVANSASTQVSDMGGDDSCTSTRSGGQRMWKPSF